MKIIYLHQYFKFPTESGATRSFDIANGFVNLGYDVEIVTSTSELKYKTKDRWVKIDKNGLLVNYIYLPYSNEMSYLKRSLVFFKFIWFSIIKLLSIRADLVLATSTPLTIGIPALIKKWIHNTPYIFETRDIWPEVVIAIGAIKNLIFKKILYFLEHLIYKHASAIVPLSVDMKNSIISRYPKLISKPIQVIENISEVNRFQISHNIKRSILKEKIGFKPRFTILYAGTFGKVNGIDYVINFANLLIEYDPSIVLVLLGEGSQKKEVKDLAASKGVLNKNVFILDPVPKEDLPNLYFECDMGSSFVIPIKELWANSANKFFDTLASGKPILINYRGWQEGTIKKENIGYILPIKLDEDDVIKFIEYSKNKLLIAKQQENALNVAKQKYATNVALKKYNRLIEDIS